MAGVQAQLRESQRRGFAQYALAVAASVLLMLNLGLATSSGVSLPRPRPARQDAAALYAEIDRMQLGLTPDEVTVQCRLLLAGADLTPGYVPHGSTGTPVLSGRSGETP